MDIFGIGPFEIVLILIVAFVFLGPKDMAKTGRTVGRFLRKVVKSSEWSAIRQVAHEIQTTPNRLIREAGIEEFEQMRRELANFDVSKSDKPPAGQAPTVEELDGFAAWTQQPPPQGSPPIPPTAGTEPPDTESASPKP